MKAIFSANAAATVLGVRLSIFPAVLQHGNAGTAGSPPAKAFDPPPPPPNTRLEVQQCLPGRPTQQWLFPADGSIRNAASGLCVTAPGGVVEGPLVTDMCGLTLLPGQLFARGSNGLLSLATGGLLINGTYGSFEYAWLRPYAPLAVASPSGPGGAAAPFQLFLADAPNAGMILATATLLSGAVCVDAGFRVPLPLVSSVFGSSMVLQRDVANAAIWGWASGASQVNVTLSQNGVVVSSVQATPDPASSGAWRSLLPRQQANLVPYDIIVATPTDSVHLQDILFGDVFIAAGQSNMQMSVDLGLNVSAELAAAESYPNIRLFTVGLGTLSAVPLPELQTVLQPWTRASRGSVGLGEWAAFSAVGWFFARDLFDARGGKVPIGIIGNNWGGTAIQCWMSPDALSQCGRLQDYDVTSTSIMANAMFVPYFSGLGRFPIAGMLWYQGEANAGDPRYACFLPALIASWRQAFASPKAWFGVVQLAAWDCCPGDAIPSMRDIQLNVSLTGVGVGFATAADLGDINSTSSSIHPRIKQPIGARLASSYLAFVTGQSDPLINPRITMVTKLVPSQLDQVAVRIDVDPASLSSTARLALNPALAACPPGVPEYNCADAGWRIQTSDSVWHGANAELGGDGRSVVLTSPAPSSVFPIAASLGWGAWPLLSVSRDDTGQVMLPFLRYIL